MHRGWGDLPVLLDERPVAAGPDADTPPLLLAACPLCHAGSGHQPLARFPQLAWVRCGCGLVYKRRAHAQAAAEHYGEAYFGSAGSGRGYDRRTRRRIAKSRHQILDVLNHVAPGPLLDIGCSMGYALRAAEALGLACCGVDCSDFAVQACRAQGLQAQLGRMGALPFADGSFAIVTMKHVLEHTPDPRVALADVARVLRPGGGVFIAVPHAGYRKAVRDPQRSGFYRPERHGTEHFLYFTPATLSRLLEDVGFRVCRVHPHLLHRQTTWPVQLVQRAFAPLRWAAQRAAESLALRKEFWVVATRAG